MTRRRQERFAGSGHKYRALVRTRPTSARRCKKTKSRTGNAMLRKGSCVIIEELVQRWRRDATLLRHYKNLQQAEWLEDRAAEVEAALQDRDRQLVNLREAAEISGYSAEHLGRQVRNGALKNWGRPHAPRVRRGDLPRKLLSPGLANRDLVGASRRQVAKAITTSESSRR